MAKPRIFISSTYYDLKYIRASLDLFIEGLGYESILSEKGDIAYSHDRPLDESCYHEVENIDIFVLIIGGRYGSEVSSGDKRIKKSFFERYESVTKTEYETAINRDVPTYILIESNVYAEYRTFLKNKENETIKYAHVDSVNIFNLIEEILLRPRNNPVFSFEKFEQIETWLKEQWAGLFRDILSKRTHQSQIKSLTSEINELKEVNATLKTYLEAVMSGISPDDSSKLIESEKERLRSFHIRKELENNKWFEHLRFRYNIDFEDFIEIQLKSKSYDDFLRLISENFGGKEIENELRNILIREEVARKDFNDSRRILRLSNFRKLPSNRFK